MGNLKANTKRHTETCAPILRAQLQPMKLTSYEVLVVPNVNVFQYVDLPLAVLAWLLPIGGAGLAFLALGLQMQDWMLCLQVGELFCIVSIVSVGVGYVCLMKADAKPHHQQLKEAENKLQRMSTAGALEPAPSGVRGSLSALTRTTSPAGASQKGHHMQSTTSAMSQDSVGSRMPERRRDVFRRKMATWTEGSDGTESSPPRM